jgi:chromosome segregation ATPase
MVPPVSPISGSQVPIYDIDQVILDAAEADLLSASERNGYLEGEVKLLRRHLGQCEDAIELYDEREVASQQRIQDLEAELAHLQHELKQSQSKVLSLFAKFSWH